MASFDLGAVLWNRIEGFLPGNAGGVGSTVKDSLNLVNGVLWVRYAREI